MRAVTRRRLKNLYLVLTCPAIYLGATVTGCSSVQAVDDYAREHNIFGDRVCNAEVEDVLPEDVLVRGCPAGEPQDHVGDIPNDLKEEVEEKEEAL